MSLESYIFELITTDLELNALGINEDSTFLSHSLDTPQIRPMAVIRWQAVAPGIGPMNRRVFQVWVHDHIGNYGVINEALIRLRTLCTNVAGVNVGRDDAWLHTIVWEGDSDDIRDDEARTFTRNAQFRATGSGF